MSLPAFPLSVRRRAQSLLPLPNRSGTAMHFSKCRCEVPRYGTSFIVRDPTPLLQLCAPGVWLH